jgi:hypothetical protein
MKDTKWVFAMAVVFLLLGALVFEVLEKGPLEKIIEPEAHPTPVVCPTGMLGATGATGF